LSAGSLPKSFFIGGPRTVPRWRACSRQFPLRSVLSLRTGEPQKVIHQLRIYEIFDANKKPFHDRFRDHAMRIMAKYDFKIVATWESKKDNRTEFVYLLEWPDKETMTDRWKKILQDQEWIKIKKETGDISGPFVGKIQDLTLYLTDYSPRQVLAK
jgi:NIPSNAP